MYHQEFFFEYTEVGEMKKRHVDSIWPHPAKLLKTTRNISDRFHQKALNIAPRPTENPHTPGLLWHRKL